MPGLALDVLACTCTPNNGLQARDRHGSAVATVGKGLDKTRIPDQSLVVGQADRSLRTTRMGPEEENLGMIHHARTVVAPILHMFSPSPYVTLPTVLCLSVPKPQERRGEVPKRLYCRIRRREKEQWSLFDHERSPSE